MQYFESGTKVLVSRKSCYSTSDLDLIDNLDKSLRFDEHTIGWLNLSMLLAGDKVLVYDNSQKSFSWKDDIDFDACSIKSNFIELYGHYYIGGTGYSDSLVAYKNVDENTMCICSFDDNDEIECHTAKELFDIGKKEFYSPSGKRERIIYIYTLGRNIDTYDSIEAPRKVRLNWENCKQSGVVLRPALSVNIDNKFVLLTKNSEKSMF